MMVIIMIMWCNFILSYFVSRYKLDLILLTYLVACRLLDNKEIFLFFEIMELLIITH